jgi:hypothetical protein
MDALMRVSNAFGTADSIEASNSQIQGEQLKAIAGELAVEQGRMDTEARVAAEFAAAQAQALQAAQAKAAAAGVKLPDNFAQQFQMPDFTPPTQGQGLDFSVDMDSINRQLAEQSKWASDYLASQNAGLENAYNSLIASLQADQAAQMAVAGQPVRGGSVTIEMVDSGGSSTPINQYQYPSSSTTTPDTSTSGSVPSWQAQSPINDYLAPATLPSYGSSTWP